MSDGPGLYASLGEMSRLVICAPKVDASSISAKRNQDLATCTGAPEDGGQVLCLAGDCDWCRFAPSARCPEACIERALANGYCACEYCEPPLFTFEHKFS